MTPPCRRTRRLTSGDHPEPDPELVRRATQTSPRTHRGRSTTPARSDTATRQNASADNAVGEAGSLGEATNSCGSGPGDGISPGAAGWVTLTLALGRYELICNLPGHYGAGMYIELDVT